MTMEQIWRRIRNAISSYIVDGNPPMHQALLLDAFPGAGKTTNVLAELMRLEQPFIYLAPDHDVIEENLTFHMEDYIGGFVHLKGRRHSCAVPERRDLAERYGMPIKPFCASCEIKREGGCDYYANKRAVETQNPSSWAGVHAHITTYLGQYLHGDEDRDPHADDFDILVIEENPIKQLMNTINMGRNDMAFLETELAAFTFGNDEQKDLVCLLLDYLITRLSRKFNYDIVWRNFVQPWRNFSREQWQELKDEFDAHLVKRIMNDGLQRVPFDIIMLLNDIFTTTTNETLPFHVSTTKKHDSTVISLNYFYGDALHHLPMHVVGLDGTANADVWRMVLNKEVHVEQITHKFQNVYQLSSGAYPVSSWVHKGFLRDTGKSLLRLLGIVVGTRKGTTLVIGSKRIKGFVEDYLKDEGLWNKVEYQWYYNLRSKNFVHCDTVVLLMRPGPPRQQIEIYTALSGWPEELWMDHYIKDEMIQAIARIRSNMMEVKDVYGKTRVRDRVEVFVFSKEEIFEEGSTREGTYFYINKPTMEYFIRTGISSPVRMTRNEIDVHGKIEQLLSDYEEYTYGDVCDRMGMPRVVKRCLDRMVHFDKIYYHGGKYGIVR